MIEIFLTPKLDGVQVDNCKDKFVDINCKMSHYCMYRLHITVKHNQETQSLGFFFASNTAVDTQANYSIGSAKWCLAAVETGPIHTPFRKAFKHTQIFLKKLRKVFDWEQQIRKEVIKKVEAEEE